MTTLLYMAAISHSVKIKIIFIDRIILKHYVLSFIQTDLLFPSELLWTPGEKRGVLFLMCLDSENMHINTSMEHSRKGYTV